MSATCLFVCNTMAYIELEFTLLSEYIAEYFLHKSLEVRSIHV